MPRSLADIIRSAEALADHAEAFEPADDAETTAPEMLVRRAAWNRDQAERDLATAVAAAREVGVSWRVIGETIGTSPQSAQRRYRIVVTGAGAVGSTSSKPAKRAQVTKREPGAQSGNYVAKDRSGKTVTKGRKSALSRSTRKAARAATRARRAG
jgi:hypothetical protein